MKRLISSLMVIALVLIALPAFTEENHEPITLTAFVDYLPNPPNWTWGQDPSSRRITELTGVTIDIENAGTTDHTELNTMLASGMELPDFIVTDALTNLRKLMVDQGFVLPLTDLANEYAPEFWDNLPLHKDKVFMEEDGKLYVEVGWFGDEKGHADLLLNNFAQMSVSVNIDIYEELGRPDVSTFEGWKDFLIKAKDKHPEIGHVIYDSQPNIPTSSQSLLNLLARAYGAESNYFSFGEDDKVTMNFRTDGYKKALRRYNELYRAGLINPELFVYKEEQKKGVLQDRDLVSYVGAYWGLIEGMNELFTLLFETIDFPLPEDGVAREDFFIHDDYFSVGSKGVFITKDTKAPDRAIQYLTFLMSREGQLIQRYGVEGIAWEADDMGRPKPTALKSETEAEDFQKLQRELGVYNYQFSWNNSCWVNGYGAHNTYTPWPGMMQDIQKIQSSTRNELLYDIVNTLPTEDGLVLRQQIYDLWDRSVAAIVLAETDETFESAYNQFIQDAEHMGVDQLEAYFEENLMAQRAKGL